jgi:hypothetical protein
VNLCSICQQPIRGIFKRDWFCHDCYIEYRSEILAKVEWVRVCQNHESRRRRQEARDGGLLIYLGNRFDVAMINGKAEIVPRQEYFQGED